MLIKVCGNKHLDNILAIADSSPDLMGYIFYPKSKRYVGDDPDPEIFSRIPKTIQKTGVFVNAERKNIIDKINRYNLQNVQLHGDETPYVCARLKKENVTIIKAIRVEDGFYSAEIADYLPVVDYFLFDTGGKSYGGTGKKFNWDVLDRYMFQKPFFLSGGIDPGDAGKVLKMKHPFLKGIDINSRFESAPGVKNTAQVKTFISRIRNEKEQTR